MHTQKRGPAATAREAQPSAAPAPCPKPRHFRIAKLQLAPVHNTISAAAAAVAAPRIFRIRIFFVHTPPQIYAREQECPSGPKERAWTSQMGAFMRETAPVLEGVGTMQPDGGTCLHAGEADAHAEH